MRHPREVCCAQSADRNWTVSVGFDISVPRKITPGQKAIVLYTIVKYHVRRDIIEVAAVGVISGGNMRKRVSRWQTTLAAVVIWGGSCAVNVLAEQGPDALPKPPARSVSEFLTPDGRFDLDAARLSGFEGSLDLDGTDLRFDPRTGEPRVRPSTSLTPTDDPDDIYWDNSISPSISGIDGDIFAAIIYNGQLVVGGYFQVANDVIVSYIAAWDGTAWSPLGSGMNGPVFALTVYNGNLIAGGSFISAGGASANYIASWDGNSWSPLGLGMTNRVYALSEYDGKLIAGGGFWTAGGVLAIDIASWNGSSWSPLGRGIDGDVSALTVYDGKLIVGGRFGTAGNVAANSIASWNGSNWSPMGSGMGGRTYPSPFVYALTVHDAKLTAGGYFTIAGNKVSAYLAQWTKSTTDVEEHDGTNLPDAFSLVQNYPNPFNPATTIEYKLPSRTQVTIEIFNVLGQKVRTLVNETKAAGSYSTEWDGIDDAGKAVSTGVYLYRYSAGEVVQTKKMMLLK
jgi:hypothetical protein